MRDSGESTCKGPEAGTNLASEGQKESSEEEASGMGVGEGRVRPG